MSDPRPAAASNWELVAFRLEQLEKSIGDLGGKFVTAELFKVIVEGMNGRIEQKGAEIAELNAKSQDAEKLKRSQQLAVTLAIVSPIAGFLLGILGRTVGA